MNKQPIDFRVTKAESDLQEMRVMFAQLAAQEVMFRDLLEHHEDKLIDLERRLRRQEQRIKRLLKEQRVEAR